MKATALQTGIEVHFTEFSTMTWKHTCKPCLAMSAYIVGHDESCRVIWNELHPDAVVAIDEPVLAQKAPNCSQRQSHNQVPNLRAFLLKQGNLSLALRS
jgi:hypothetical protein